MIVLDISNKHKKKYVAFAISISNMEHIIASDTKKKLINFLTANVKIFDDFYVFNGCGRLVDAYKYNTKLNATEIMLGNLAPKYTKIKF